MTKLLAAVVVLYNPDISIINNIKSYINEVDILFIVDNSDKKNISFLELITQLPKTLYTWNGGNIGIAHALNIGAAQAMSYGYKWLLTMDQDSRFPPKMISSYIHCFNHYPNKEKVAVFSSTHHITTSMYTSTPCHPTQELLVMTSGNIINLSIFKELRGFEEKLFIDQVDFDYCLRASQKEFKIIKFQNISLSHNLGEKKSVIQQGKATYFFTHSPKRFYYITRNRLYMWKTYRTLFPKIEGLHLIKVLKTLIYPLIYHDQKFLRFFYISRGIFHFMIGRYGK
jgi:rhamnosyltransferase